MQSLTLGLQSLNHSDLSLKVKTALKCISAAVEEIVRRRHRRVLPYAMSEFQLDDYTDDWCYEFLRFLRQEIRYILPFIRLDLYAYRFRYNPSPETAFCPLLYKLTWPHRLKDTLNLFSRSRAWQSSVFNDTVLHLVSRYRDMLY
jgi:hypothetical protein